MSNQKKSTRLQKKIIKPVSRGRIYVTATFNNTLATITDEQGHPLCWGSTGRAGFSGSRKSTPYAATIALEKVINEAKNMGIKNLEVYIKGPGPGRDAALRVLRASGVSLSLIADVTPVPHNGTRPRKKKHNR
jgi:small subunit ribosomal protein S11